MFSEKLATEDSTRSGALPARGWAFNGPPRPVEQQQQQHTPPPPCRHTERHRLESNRYRTAPANDIETLQATMAASDQIRQMVNFILQEAHEKANEIRVKVSVRTLFYGFISVWLEGRRRLEIFWSVAFPPTRGAGSLEEGSLSPSTERNSNFRTML